MSWRYACTFEQLIFTHKIGFMMLKKFSFYVLFIVTTHLALSWAETTPCKDLNGGLEKGEECDCGNNKTFACTPPTDSNCATTFPYICCDQAAITKGCKTGIQQIKPQASSLKVPIQKAILTNPK